MYSKILNKLETIKNLLNMLTKKDEIQEEVKDEILPLDESLQNQVPYISTYYIKPIVEPDEEVFLDFFIRNYFGDSLSNNEEDECIYKAIVRIEGREEMIFRNLRSGDHKISLGKFNECKEYKFSIVVMDNYGRYSHELFNFFMVKSQQEDNIYIMTEQDLTTYNISNKNDENNLSNTREGLQKLLDDKQALGYTGLKMLNGIYRIDHSKAIYIPDHFTLDMNGATLKLHGFAGAGAMMLELNQVHDSHIINGILEGDYYDHDYENSDNNSEWVNGLAINSSSMYCSVENMTIKDITGYGATNGISKDRDGNASYVNAIVGINASTYKQVDIDRDTGEEKESSNRCTSDFTNIEKLIPDGYFSVSRYLGYQGLSGSSWNLLCHFYDENKNFIRTTDAYQYRRIRIPEGAKYVRITTFSTTPLTDISMQYFKVPTHCAFKNIKFDNCRCVGMAQAAMNNMLVESCEFTKCGQTSANCAYDAEDGWDMMQDVTFRKLNFHDNPSNEFLTCAGHNFIIEDMINGKVYIWGRTKDLVLRNSTCSVVSLRSHNLVQHGYYRVNNVHCDSMTAEMPTDIIRHVTSTGALNGNVYDSVLGGLPVSSSIKTQLNNCSISLSDEETYYLAGDISLSNCTLKPKDTNDDRYRLSFNDSSHTSKYLFTNCVFEGMSNLANHNSFTNGRFENCKFEDTRISMNVCGLENEEVVFENCEINSTHTDLVWFGPYAYSIGTLLNLKFIKCDIKCTKAESFIYGYAKPCNAYITFDGCSVEFPENANLLDGYPSGLDLVENVNFKLINTNITNTNCKHKYNDGAIIIEKVSE